MDKEVFKLVYVSASGRLCSYSLHISCHYFRTYDLDKWTIPEPGTLLFAFEDLGSALGEIEPNMQSREQYAIYRALGTNPEYWTIMVAPEAIAIMRFWARLARGETQYGYGIAPPGTLACQKIMLLEEVWNGAGSL